MICVLISLPCLSFPFFRIQNVFLSHFLILFSTFMYTTTLPPSLPPSLPLSLTPSLSSVP